MDIKAIARKAGRTLEKNSSYILTGCAAAGVVGTAIMTGYSSIKAYKIIKEHESNDWDHEEWLDYKKNPWKNWTKWTWKCYIPPVLMGAASIACIVGAQNVNTKRYAALASVYSITQETLKEYQQRVVEKIGEKKESEIREDMAQEKLDKNPKSTSEVIITGKGETLFYDAYSGRYFKSDIETLRKLQNDFNHELMGQMWVHLNDLYYALGLNGVKMGDELGWTVDELLEFRFTPKISDDNQPCIVLDFNVSPKYLTFGRCY